MDISGFPPPVVTVTLNPAIDRTVTISRFTAGAVNRVEHMSDRAGGKGVNVAAALAGNGHAIAATGFLGRDNGDVFTAFFSEHGIADRCIRLPGATRTGIKIVDPARHETTDINFPGLAPPPADLAALRGQLGTLTGGWCVLAGSLPPGVQADIYREFIGTLEKRGVRTVLDASGEALREGLKAAPDIIKPNIHELEAYAGRTLATEGEVVAAARGLVAGGVKLAVVSRGADGAYFVTADEVVRATPPAVEVGSTVGAGDAMVAGIVAAQLRGLSLAEGARLATAFALAALTRPESSTRTDADAWDKFSGRVRIAVV